MTDRKFESSDNPTRGEQLRMLQLLQLPEVTLPSANGKARPIPPFTMKAVLRVIDDRIGPGRKSCWACQDTLAEDANCSVKTVSRAITALEILGIVELDRSGRTNEVVIRWDTIRGMIPDPRSEVVTETEDSRTTSAPWSGEDTAVADTGPSVLSDRTDGPIRSDPRSGDVGPTVRSPRTNGPTNIKGTSKEHQTNINNNWESLEVMLSEWGLFSSKKGCHEAIDRGWTPDYVMHLFHKVSGCRTPTQDELAEWHPEWTPIPDDIGRKKANPGLLANWLTGKTDPPISFERFEILQAERRRKRDE